MTTVYKEKKICAVCGTEHEYIQIASTNTFGSPDLDTRPPEMKRSTIFAWVQRCPVCGYCASDISKATHQARSIVRDTTYQEQLTNPDLPELANSFLCKAIIDKDSSNYPSAAWALIHAAWVCDDSNKPKQAKKFRNKAADMIIKVIELGQEFTGQPGTEVAILVDLLRRADRFSEAQRLIEITLPAIREEIILKVLAFQETLIANADNSCHTIAEAIVEKE